MSSTLRTTLLLALLTGLLIIIGRAVAGVGGMIFAFILALVMNFSAYWYSDRIVLTMYRAREVSPQEAPRLHSLVESIAARAGIPKPRVYIIDTATPNAFATGRDPEHAAVAVTTGILELLSEEELAGVLAHEIAHIKNRDTLISTIAATIAGVITMIATWARWAAIFAPAGRDREGVAHLIGVLVLSVVAPVAALIIQLAISRAREYLADETGARITGMPLALANALRKLEYGVARAPMREANPSTAHLFIVNPLRGSALASLFSTHPPTEERIRRLEAMAMAA
ncbi:MAG: zinc metalloprotease HtpX [Euryarchaeota archaeon]|nr:zinc metalloprotease HtpX [Euryarchaeota archaeon]